MDAGVSTTCLSHNADVLKADLNKTGVMFHKVNEASTLASDLIMVSGEVPRVTDFEKGFPWAEAKIDGKWVVDPFHDDQGIVVNVKGRGLVVIGGCSHAGIINTVKHVQKVARTSKVHAVLGGKLSINLLWRCLNSSSLILWEQHMSSNNPNKANVDAWCFNRAWRGACHEADE